MGKTYLQPKALLVLVNKEKRNINSNSTWDHTKNRLTSTSRPGSGQALYVELNCTVG